MTPILAHFGHWYYQLLYLAPVGALWLQGWREKRHAKQQSRRRRN